MDTKTKTKKPRQLTGKQKTFVAEYIKNGKNATQAALKAYPNQTYDVARSVASQNLTKPNIQEAINQALVKLEATPEMAVSKVVDVANMELNSKTATNILRASETILELHGWRKDDRPTMTLNVNQFFAKGKKRDNTRDNVIDQ